MPHFIHFGIHMGVAEHFEAHRSEVQCSAMECNVVHEVVDSLVLWAIWCTTRQSITTS